MTRGKMNFSSFFSDKKGQGMSMQMVATIVLVLVGLVIIIIIIATKLNFFSDIDSCEKRGYICQEQCSDLENQYRVPFPCKVVEGQPKNVCCAVRPDV